MKPVVAHSVEAPDGLRCVDILQGSAGGFAHVECRLDPGDGHGWRRLGAPSRGAGGAAEVLDAARRDIDRLAGNA
ncbi:hypothetical protein U879_06580 [Defluviimonas sp. 20V17]|uniref:Uncharacterized protein n=1 Tax=Allgaiera indica TaxID=765699 RepID=A0AAN4UVC0_9RHOB|nr:hypothetical protein [Allgaiera indica]KDB04483.1 hypothetical protein U879_06580 [Defluviimonas sp. 20V17]GHE06158.1 hypothetical protein GCM10008024_39660 [Allgaiera indica]SDX86783.1 hypothetical protein SAMN05444006_13526 [Allgaiera indica]